jgi:hypothetical protein
VAAGRRAQGVFAAAGDEDLGSGLGQFQRHRRSDTRAAAGHERDLTFE